MYRLVSMPQVDVSLLPLHLEVPDSINTGGYCVPSSEGSVYVYSPIDLLVAGLEANLNNHVVSDLVTYLDQWQGHTFSECEVFLTLCHGVILYQWSIAQIKRQIINAKDQQLLTVMLHNAPLTFKWVKI